MNLTTGKTMPEFNDLFYQNTAKDCKNCFYYNSKWFTFSKCNRYPTWLTEDALKTCRYKEWQPNQKLYDKFERKGIQ